MPIRLNAEAVAFTAAVRKEALHIWRYRANVAVVLVTAVLAPASYLVQAWGFAGGDRHALDAFAARSGTADIAAFIYLGWAVYLWVSLLIWGPGMALRHERMQGSLEVVMLSPVSRFTVLFAPATAHLVPALLLFAVVGTMLRVVFGLRVGLDRLALGLLFVAASVPALFALGALFAVVVLRFRDAEGVAAVLRGLMAIVCGVSYPVAVLPEWLQPISRALPPTQVIDDLRAAVLSPVGVANPWARTAGLLVVGAALSLVAWATLVRALRAARRTGRMGQY
jgi:ABC-2 type transport system permease protein